VPLGADADLLQAASGRAVERVLALWRQVPRRDVVIFELDRLEQDAVVDEDRAAYQLDLWRCDACGRVGGRRAAGGGRVMGERGGREGRIGEW
jgi:hypothetical protein